MTGPISAVVIIIAVFMVVIAFKKKLSPYETERTDFIEEELKQVIDIHAHSFKGNIIGKVITTIFISFFTLYLYSSLPDYVFEDEKYIKILVFIVFGGLAIGIIGSIIGIFHAVESNRILQEGTYTIERKKLVRKYYRSGDNSTTYYAVFENDKKRYHIYKEEYLRARINDEYYIFRFGKNSLIFNSAYYRLSEDDKYKLI